MILLSINWNPNIEIFSIGPLSIRYYSLMFVLAFLLGLQIMKKVYKNDNVSIEKLDSLIDNDEVIKTLGKQILKGDSRAMNLYFGYRYGKPKESVDITSSEGLNINFKDLIKFK